MEVTTNVGNKEQEMHEDGQQQNVSGLTGISKSDMQPDPEQIYEEADETHATNGSQDAPLAVLKLNMLPFPAMSGKLKQKDPEFMENIHATSSAPEESIKITEIINEEIKNLLPGHNKLPESVNNNGNGENEITNHSPTSPKLNKCCGIKLTRPEYYTIPPLKDIEKYQNESGSCIVKDFTIGRYGYGNVIFPDAVDVANLNLDDIVHFGFQSIELYPDDNKKPTAGQGLNKPAQITLDNVWPRHHITQEILKDPKDIKRENFFHRLFVQSQKQNAELKDYHSETGSWIFSVQHFSKFEFNDAVDAEIADELKKKNEELELKQKQMEKMSVGENSQKVAEPQTTPIGHGLGGNLMPLEGPGPTSNFPLSQTKFSSSLTDDPRSFVIMKSALFDEGSISDDVSSISEMSMPCTSSGKLGHPLLVFPHQKSKADLPKCYRLRTLTGEVPIGKSLLKNSYSRNYMDMRLFKGKSFKVGWGPGFTFNTVTTPNAIADLPAINEGHVLHRPNTLLCLGLGNFSSIPQTMYLEEHLQVVFDESTVTIDSSQVPSVTMNKNYNGLIRHKQIAEDVDQDTHTVLSHYRNVWNLCVALWGPEADSPYNQRELFSEWLEKSANIHLQTELSTAVMESSTAVLQNIFVYLSGHKVETAVHLAMDKDMPRLAILISQASANESSKMLLHQQLEQWKEHDYIKTIPHDMLKIYMLLAGVPVTNNVNICEGLDWRRALAIHLWYVCPPGASLIHAVQAYELAFTQSNYAKPPTPNYYEYTDAKIYDVLYLIMKLFATPTTPLEKIINPTSYTDDPLDYRMSWLLMQVFTAVGVGTISEKVLNSLHMSFASQLENLGLWKWAIFVTLFIKDISIKKNAVISILERNLQTDRSNDNVQNEDHLVNDFKIPPQWIHTILGNKTYFLEKHVESFKHFVLADDWYRAHEIAIEHVIPKFIASGQCEELSEILKTLIPGQKHILQWNSEAGLVLEFLQLQQEIMMNYKYIAETDLKYLTASLTSLCQRMKAFPTKSLKQTLAAVELSKFMTTLLNFLYFEAQPPMVKNIEHVTVMLGHLFMPPDYKQEELKKYVRLYLKLK